jgi:hemerythrin-like domain-containing protein
MNRATHNLENDHIYILQLTEVMEKIAGRTEIDPLYVEEVIDLIRNYADGLHHAKEENLLFPLMVEKGFSTDNGPVAVMLTEHIQGREYVKKMTEGVSLLKQGDYSAASIIREAMLGYAVLLQNHIAKENNILFRMADNLMSEPEEEQVFADFRQIDKGEAKGIAVSDYIERVKRLKETYY